MPRSNLMKKLAALTVAAWQLGSLGRSALFQKPMFCNDQRSCSHISVAHMSSQPSQPGLRSLRMEKRSKMKNSSKYYLTYCIELIGSLIKTLRYLRHQNNDNPLTDYKNISKTMQTHVACRHVWTCPDQRLAFSSHSSTGWDLQGYVTSVHDIHLSST